MANTNYYLLDIQGYLYTVGNSRDLVPLLKKSSDVVETDFTVNGLTDATFFKLSDILSNLKLSDNLLCFNIDGSTTCNITAQHQSTEVVYGVSINGTIYVRFNGAWISIQESDLYRSGMTSTELKAITKDQFMEIFQPGNVTLKSALRSNTKYLTPSIDNVQITFPKKYITGTQMITTTNNQFNTVDWNYINNIVITQSTPLGTDIRYAFSNDGRNNWNVYKNGGWNACKLTDLPTQGMTESEVEILSKLNWNGLLKDTLDIAIILISNNATETPTVDQITVNYMQLDQVLASSSISIPVPQKGYKNVLTDEVNVIYSLQLADGIAFDDTTVDYNFYTTSDKLHLRPLDMGTMIGGRQQNIFAVEIINSYTDKNFLITLRGTTNDGVVAEEKGNYGLLFDSPDLAGRTKFELSTDYNNFNTAVYPLQFNLNAGERKNVYIRVTPTIYGSIGTKQLQLKLTGKPL